MNVRELRRNIACLEAESNGGQRNTRNLQLLNTFCCTDSVHSG